MNVLNVQKVTNSNKKGWFKKRPARFFFVLVGVILIFITSFVAYIYATGMKIFDGKQSGLLGVIKGEQSSTFKEDRVNILIMGRGGENHPGGLLTDSIMILSIKPKEKKVAMLSIPRDLLVTIKGNGQDKINSAYADGYNSSLKTCKKKNKSDCTNEAMAAGANLSRSTVSETFGIPIHYYIVGDFVGFEKIVDELGGVDINVEKTIYDPLYPDDNMQGYKPFMIKAGQQHLDGKTALKFARSRETTSDFDRAKRQQQLLLAIKEKASKAGILTNPKKVIDITSILGDHLRTDLSPGDFKTLAEIAKDVQSGNFINKVLDSSANGPLINDSSTGTYYLRTRIGNNTELQKIAKEIFDNPTTTETIKIDLINGSGVKSNTEKVASILRKQGHQVTTTESKELYKKTVIYQYSTDNKKIDVIGDIKNSFNAALVTRDPGQKKSDISIIIGQDYKG